MPFRMFFSCDSYCNCLLIKLVCIWVEDPRSKVPLSSCHIKIYIIVEILLLKIYIIVEINLDYLAEVMYYQISVL